MADESLELAIIASGILASGHFTFLPPISSRAGQVNTNPTPAEWEQFHGRLVDGKLRSHPSADSAAALAKLVHRALKK